MDHWLYRVTVRYGTLDVPAQTRVKGRVDVMAADRSGAIEIAERVWWVGSVRPDDTFQCHSYLIEADDNSVLIDPGSVLSVDETLRRAGEVVPLSSIRWVVCHHSDPDIAGGLSVVRKALPSKSYDW